jgi:hypothetical protein
LASLIMHLVALLLLALLTFDLPFSQLYELTVGIKDAAQDDVENFEELSPASIDMATDTMPTETSATTDVLAELPVITDATDLTAPQVSVELSEIGFEANTPTDLMQEVGAYVGSGLAGRSAAEKARLVREAGGTEGSEAAVQRGLQWIKIHQSLDGGWSFFHLGGQCPCTGHGKFANARIGATAMALLPFLGAGHTHREGAFQKEVNAGLYFLLSHQQVNGSLWENEGNMYSHGLAAIVLCEAYAMTGDKALQKPAQEALNFIAFAQDPIGGGWRYKPRIEPGDTSVVGWQLMALKSGHMAGLYVNGNTINGAKAFLDSVQAENGASYGYMAPGSRPATNSIGLLCRMYLGWTHDHPALTQGVARLAKSGPSDVNMYYNYYATQVLRHYGGEPWEEWNPQMRDWLVKKQEKGGHKEGSWLIGDDHTDKGGRLYCTSMATMILEVYYRHLPIYGKGAAEVDFPL